MVRSMTGFGRAQRLVNGRDITVEIKAVNHRYFEFSTRLPRAYGYLEDRLKTLLQGSISRGKVEAAVLLQTVDGPSAQVKINRELALTYVENLRQLGRETGIPDDLGLAAVAKLPDVFTVYKLEEDEEEIWQAVEPVARDAMEKFVAMRETEGRRLEADILSRLDTIGEKVALVEERSPQTVAEYRSRLAAKMQEILGDRQVDEGRILTEAAIYADRVAVDEETVRLRSHLHQFREILAGSDPVGRKLDFLVQEINRETNTIGSKAQDVAIAQIVVDLKAEIEKVREQIQNME